MILTGNKIIEEVKSGKIEIAPFDKKRITTNSYDLSLGDTLIRYKTGVIDPKQKTPHEEIKIPADGLVLQAGEFVLGHSRTDRSVLCSSFMENLERLEWVCLYV